MARIKDLASAFFASKRRIFLLIVPIIISLHFLFGFISKEYHPVQSVVSKAGLGLFSSGGRVNATLMMLCRNSELDGVISSVRQIEDRFNHQHHYPWVFLNDEPFTDEFKKRVSILTQSEVKFGLIPEEDWKQPSWIDEKKAKKSRQDMKKQWVPYADNVAYRNMCRWNSGFFHKHELLLPYKYYWRIEPNVQYFCDIVNDPFQVMQRNGKTYGFTISLVEIPATVATLWEAVKEFMELYPQYIAKNNAMTFVSDNEGADYNFCHYWSNFEVADMDFYRGEAYTKFFEFLDSKGGFYYERWGDAPVHSIAVSILKTKSDVQYFRDIGYKHDNFGHCPSDGEWEKGRCSCDPQESFNKGGYSCTWGWVNLVH
ncbi:alpha-1,2 mannosyltransferase KTR1 [Coprinopsis marcescibilis]|uniref:Alpha-1,2 mannosyltransferase KTR1 n=1 Tax=Coprinopsis marcescibilis TaxID=230819 RepID=A0A5C3KSJ2_COPMA|nr:alpha-1,2 mannosyltransferase KTR1 [Coprinopsis marcescibilis]